jgi:subtilisin family serine protease
MSITKWGTDDHDCGAANKDVLHVAVCRVVKDGTTIVAAAANDSGNAAARVPGSYDEVITVSALADTDGLAGGLGGKRCYSWGGYDSDDTFADFSNYGSDVDLIAPGKCIWSTVPGGGYKYMSGTSMAAPHVTGAVALLKASRPYLTPAEVKEALVYLGTLNWKVTSDPDSKHEKLLDLSKLGPRGDFTVGVGLGGTLSELGGTANYSVGLTRSSTSFERVTFRTDGLPAGVRATFGPPSVYGFNGEDTTMTLLVAPGVAAGTYEFQVVGAEHGLGASTTAILTIRTEIPVSGGAIDRTPFDTDR